MLRGAPLSLPILFKIVSFDTQSVQGVLSIHPHLEHLILLIGLSFNGVHASMLHNKIEQTSHFVTQYLVSTFRAFFAKKLFHILQYCSRTHYSGPT